MTATKTNQTYTKDNPARNRDTRREGEKEMTKIFTINNKKQVEMSDIIARLAPLTQLPQEEKFVFRLWNMVNSEQNMYGATIHPGYPRQMTWLVIKNDQMESGYEVIENHWFETTRDGIAEANRKALSLAEREGVNVYC